MSSNPSKPQQNNPIEPQRPTSANNMADTTAPFSPPDIIAKTQGLAGVARWTAKLVRDHHCCTLLLFVDTVLLSFFTPDGKGTQLLKGLLTLPTWYGSAFWLTVVGVFLAAVIVEWHSMGDEGTKSTFTELRSIKGLRPFTQADAEIFSRLQRDQDLKDCLSALQGDSFRFGYLVAESGCGKTSFLQAGVLPSFEHVGYRGIYFRFSDLDPRQTVRSELIRYLRLHRESEIALTTVQKGSLDYLVKQVVAIDKQPLVLLFDQLEQFFVHKRSAKEYEEFMISLKALYEGYKNKIKIIFSIRADLYYYLIEIEKAFNYAPSPFEVCRLKKIHS